MPWILAGGGVVVVAVVVVLIITLTGGADTGSPEGVAEAAVSAANDQDYDKLADLTCDADKTDVKKNIDPGEIDSSLAGVKMNFELGKVETQGDSAATAEVTISFSNVPEEAKQYLKDTKGVLNLKKESGDWCVSSLGPGSSS
jgi:hypothetical protein